MILPFVEIRNTDGKGRGMFTNEPIKKNTIIEVSPVIIMSLKDKKHLDKTLLHDYIFFWGSNSEQCCMALGHIPIYNHSYKSNCEYLMNFEESYMFIKAIRSIKANEELTINYNGDWNNPAKVWFDAKD